MPVFFWKDLVKKYFLLSTICLVLFCLHFDYIYAVPSNGFIKHNQFKVCKGEKSIVSWTTSVSSDDGNWIAKSGTINGISVGAHQAGIGQLELNWLTAGKHTFKAVINYELNGCKGTAEETFTIVSL